jgi:hypothetical protein
VVLVPELMVEGLLVAVELDLLLSLLALFCFCFEESLYITPPGAAQ